MSEGLFEVKFKDDHSLKVLPTNESCIPKPNSIYAATKLAQEQLIQITCKSLGILFYNLRFQNVYGPGQSLENPYTGILSIFSKRILKRKTLLVFEDGLESRDFIYIDDLVHILVLCLSKNVEKACTINVGTGKATTILDVAKVLRSAFDSDVPIQVTGNYRLGDIRHNFADIKELINVFGYQPKVTFNEGAEKFVEWVKNQRIGEDNLHESLEEMRDKGLLK
jgi:dTDP-L-rhamnose 4-epimerase